MRIVFHGENARTFEPGFADLLGPGHEISVVADHPEGADAEAFRRAEVLIGIELDETHPRLEALRLYQAPAAGVDAIDQRLLPAGVPLCNAFGHERAIAEYVMAALLARHVPIADADRRLRKGDWRYWAGDPSATRTELGDRTLGLIGFGHIGRELAARGRAFGMRVVVANRSPVAPTALVDATHPLDRLGEVMRTADDVVVSLPLKPDTKGLIGRDAISAMKATGVLVNVGRGPVVDEAALYEALRDRRIGGAVIDTWYVYPHARNASPLPACRPFHELDNVVMTPHMAGWTHGTVRRRQQTAAENIRRLLAGEPLLNRIR